HAGLYRIGRQVGRSRVRATGNGVRTGVGVVVATHVEDGGITIGAVEHGFAIRFADRGAIAPVHADRLRGVVALDRVDQYPDGGTGRGPRFDLVGERSGVVSL